MSSNRRITRAGSRAATSVRAVTPPILDLHNLIRSEAPDTPAARTARRSESLQPIAPRESTAYGGTGITRPGSIEPAGRVPLKETLEGMLDEEEEEEEEEELLRQPQPGRARNSRTPAPADLSRVSPIRNTSRQPTPSRSTRSRPLNSAPVGLAAIDENAAAGVYGGFQPRNRENTPALTTGRDSTLFGTPSALGRDADLRTPNTPQFVPRPRVEAVRGGAPHREEVRGDSERRSPSFVPQQKAPEQFVNQQFVNPQRRVLWRAPPPSTPIFTRLHNAFMNYLINPLLSSLSTISSLISEHWLLILGVIGSLLICFSCMSSMTAENSTDATDSPAYHWYGLSDLGHNIGQFIPSRLTSTTFLDSDGKETLRNLAERVRTVEYDVAYLKRRASLDEKAINVLEDALPDFIVSKKDKSGKVQIPQDFWKALKEKISSDPDLAEGGVGTHSSWKEWMTKNEATIKSWGADDSEQAYNKHIQASFKNNVLVSKADLVKMLEENYKSSHRDIHKEIKKLSTELEAEIQSVKAEASKSSISKEETKKLVADYLKTSVPRKQLEALAEVNLNGNLKNSLSRVNHFSLKTGAIIMPKETAPTYDFGAARAPWMKRKLLSAMGRGLPRPRAPTEALTPWEEHGDCWCAAGPPEDQSYKAEPSYPQLAVAISNNIYPDEIIIEHIPQSATLTPGSAPANIDIFAYIEDDYSRGPLSTQSYNLIPNQRFEDIISQGWIRIARFHYDRNGPSAQAFPTQVKLADFQYSFGPEYSTGESPDLLKPFSRKFIIRVTGNHGEDFTCLYRVRLHGEIAEDFNAEEVELGDSIEKDEVV